MKLSTDEELAALNARFAKASPREVLAFALERFGDRITIASSFGAEDVVLLDIAAGIAAQTGRELAVFTLDTGRLHAETYELQERLRARYHLRIETYFPRHEEVEALVTEKGPFSFYDSIEARKECCRVRKVEPLGRALRGVDAWVTGLRRSQAETRTGLDVFARDDGHGGIVKVSPLASLSDDDVWSHIRAHKVPYNKLHDAGFPSIGCAPCTRAIRPGESVRAGRWWWESPEHKECGLHSATTARTSTTSALAPSSSANGNVANGDGANGNVANGDGTNADGANGDGANGDGAGQRSTARALGAPSAAKIGATHGS